MHNNQTKKVLPFTTYIPDEKDRLAIQRHIITFSCGMMFRVFLYLCLLYVLEYVPSPTDISSQKTAFDEFTDRNVIVFSFEIMPLFFGACAPTFFLYKIWKVETKGLETLNHYDITSDVIHYGLITWLLFCAEVIKKAYSGIFTWISLTLMVFITYLKVRELYGGNK
ncbi:hypothetical protein BB559_003831 [Furculomyces boomerangus]|uniref:Uncharacterized protein n=2 Tax=Harpellales TaxID=61421 RepID=A0A2T9YII8_9FUNG|nr:hypothetical protein BB559_003831 [Furculomyces boomerangus]PWA02195.1 hypothetical protein BB558_001668 [Smittium angustum]